LIIGVLLTKSLIGIPLGWTLRDLYLHHHAKIVLPLYAGPDLPLFETIG
jgi:hypothetical protein